MDDSGASPASQSMAEHDVLGQLPPLQFCGEAGRPDVQSVAPMAPMNVADVSKKPSLGGVAPVIVNARLVPDGLKSGAVFDSAPVPRPGSWNTSPFVALMNSDSSISPVACAGGKFVAVASLPKKIELFTYRLPA